MLAFFVVLPSLPYTFGYLLQEDFFLFNSGNFQSYTTLYHLLFYSLCVFEAFILNILLLVGLVSALKLPEIIHLSTKISFKNNVNVQ